MTVTGGPGPNIDQPGRERRSGSSCIVMLLPDFAAEGSVQLDRRAWTRAPRRRAGIPARTTTRTVPGLHKERPQLGRGCGGMGAVRLVR